jgi:predicted site-specific integrase-resolvase
MSGEIGLVREAEAARLLGLSVRTLQKWRWTGKGPEFVRLNGAVRYQRSDLDRFVASARRTSTSDPGPMVAGIRAA